MRQIVLPRVGTVAAWRGEVRKLMAGGVSPDCVQWHVGAAVPDLFSDGAPARDRTEDTRAFTLPRVALSGIECALCHPDPERFARAHRVVWRMACGDLRWSDRTDPAMRRLLADAKAVRRDIHKMHAFVRFRETPSPSSRRAFVAWFEPDGPILEAAAPFFANRFGDMDWVIATPGLTAVFRDGRLTFAETEARPPEAGDATEDLWRTYYASIFNPARLKTRAMQSEMPRKYWKNLPEADLIPGLIRDAHARSAEMVRAAPTHPPAHAAALRRKQSNDRRDAPVLQGMAALRGEADACRRCSLHGPATGLVWGCGPQDAELMIVGEQPGDREDLEGRPFVGPAGEVLRCTAAEAGLDLDRVWLTNAVKHFKFRPDGRRRLHQRPERQEIEHCRWWLDLERQHVAPRLTIALGATAAQALTGSGRDITARRGRWERARDGGRVLITLHPSYLLRLRDRTARDARQADFLADLARAADWLKQSRPG